METRDAIKTREYSDSADDAIEVSPIVSVEDMRVSRGGSSSLDVFPLQNIQ